jgi:glycosyltransferase involved in cell wall biosynthesis
MAVRTINLLIGAVVHPPISKVLSETYPFLPDVAQEPRTPEMTGTAQEPMTLEMTGKAGEAKEDRNPDVTVIIPTINEEAGIGLVLDSIPKVPDLKIEVLVVDTDSTDRTKEIARQKGARVINESRRGYGRAYKTGFENARADIVATLDADCTYPAEEIPALVKMLRDEKLDFITGDRLTGMEKGAMSAKHKFGNWVLSTTMNLFFGTGLKDSQSGMWVFRRSILDKLELTSTGMAMSEEIKVEAKRKGFIVKEVPIAYRPRKGEVKLRSWGDGTKNLRFLFWKKFLKNKTNKN